MCNVLSGIKLERLQYQIMNIQVWEVPQEIESFGEKRTYFLLKNFKSWMLQYFNNYHDFKVIHDWKAVYSDIMIGKVQPSFNERQYFRFRY